MSRGSVSAAKDVPLRNNPWIGEFTAEDGDSSYLIFVEQRVHCSVNSFTKALFIWFEFTVL